jgi:hypothetical protein
MKEYSDGAKKKKLGAAPSTGSPLLAWLKLTLIGSNELTQHQVL